MKQKYRDAFMEMAVIFGQTSEATRKKVGALLVKNGAIISCGVNGTPPGWPSEVCEGADGLTLPHVRHAEVACLSKGGLKKEAVRGSTMFVSLAPCYECSRKITTAGIKKVYFQEQYRDNSGIYYLKENNVDVEQI
jgi:dCMP deaminase